MPRHSQIIAVSVFVACTGLCATAGELVNVTDVLDKYTEAREKFRSCIIKSKDTYKEKNIITIPAYMGSSGSQNRTEQSEFRYDGRRYYNHLVRSSNDRPSYYQSVLHDGRQYFYRSQTSQGKEPDLVRIYPKAGEPDAYAGIERHAAAPLLGTFDGDRQPIDRILREAGSISLRDRKERAGESDCYVIDAVTKRGKYTLWIDPEHGYNIARAQASRSGADLFKDKPLAETYMAKGVKVKIERAEFSMKDIRFQKIKNVWVPMTASMEVSYKLSNGDSISSKQSHTRTEVILDPDHEASGSFVPKFPNGSKVEIMGGPRAEYIWQDGKYLPK